MNQLDAIVTEFKRDLQKIYGDQFTELILFGSYARGDFHAESDIDFAVVLRDSTTRTTDEIMRISPLSAELSYKYGVMVSVLPVSAQKLTASMQGVYQNIRKEGIRV